MASVWTTGADTIKTIVTAIPGIAEVTQGYGRYGDHDNWEQSMLALTPEQQGKFRFSIDTVNYLPLDASRGWYHAELAVHVPKDAATNADKAWELAMKVVDALGNQANFVDIGLIPFSIRIELDRIDVVETGGIAFFSFGRPGSGGIEMVDP